MDTYCGSFFKFFNYKKRSNHPTRYGECNEADCTRVVKFLKDFGCIKNQQNVFKTCMVRF